MFDDRENVSSGEKLVDADLIGIPYRLVVSKKTKENVELKKREETQSEIVSLEEAIKLFKK